MKKKKKKKKKKKEEELEERAVTCRSGCHSLPAVRPSGRPAHIYGHLRISIDIDHIISISSFCSRQHLASALLWQLSSALRFRAALCI